MKKKINIINIINLIFISIFIYLLNKINLIPKKYFIIILIILVIYFVFCFLLTNMKYKITKIIGIILTIISILISIIGSYFVYNGDRFLNKSFDNASDYTVINYYIVTYSDSLADNERDIFDTLYYTSEANISSAIEEFSNNINIETKLYEDVSDLFIKLANKEISFVLISKSLYESIFEIDKTLNRDNYKIIYKFNVSIKNIIDEVRDTNNKSNSFNIYIGGSDFANLMDFNMIVTINMKTHKVLLTSIPRDYYIEEYGQGGKKDTLSYMGANGILINKKSLENLFNINIDYYLKVNTKSLVGIVDTIGGINYCSDFGYLTTHAMVLDTYDDRLGKKLYIKEGCQQLNGIQTLTLARERNAFLGKDRRRQINCQAIIIDIFEKLKSVNTITNYNNILNSISELYETTISRNRIENIMQDTINGSNWTFEEQLVDGIDAIDYVHLTTLKDWVMYPDMNTVNDAKIKIETIYNGNVE